MQAALGAVRDADALEFVGTVARNVAVAPAEAKYRRLRRSNARVAAALAAAGVEEALAALGWVADGDDALVLPPGVGDMAQAGFF